MYEFHKPENILRNTNYIFVLGLFLLAPYCRWQYFCMLNKLANLLYSLGINRISTNTIIIVASYPSEFQSVATGLSMLLCMLYKLETWTS